MSLKNCLLVLKNKKINNFESANALIGKFGCKGVYFDRVEYCAYDDSEEITRSLRECKDWYANLIIFCPASMFGTLKSFAEKLFEGNFDGLGIMRGKPNVFLMAAEGEKRLTPEDVLSVLTSDGFVNCGRAVFKSVGAPASQINSIIANVKETCTDFDFNVSEKFSDCTIEMIYPQSVAKSVYDDVYRRVVVGLNEYVYALEDISLEERLFQLLKLRRMKISVAESFTGGGLSKRLVSVPGISEVFFEGLNTYANQAKVKRLGVDELTLKQHGAVSEETACQMVEGLLSTDDCDIAVSTTGIAGPQSDSSAKPVGLLYIAVGTNEKISVYKYRLNGSRERITETAINLALFHVFKFIK